MPAALAKSIDPPPRATACTIATPSSTHVTTELTVITTAGRTRLAAGRAGIGTWWLMVVGLRAVRAPVRRWNRPPAPGSVKADTVAG
jgi:hypothetical protein